jgi:hypothetical protein
MSDDLGKYAFLPWLRQGISTQVTPVEGDAVPLRANVHVEVQIGGGEESKDPIPLDIGLFGPADVKSFDARAVTRHWPRADVLEVEPNFFPLIELFPADLAWRYTPARANPADRLRPWLALVVLRDDEIDAIDGPTANRPHSKLTTKSGAPLPRVDQLWTWAHVHVDGQDDVDILTMHTILDDDAHRVIARLLCPRRLESSTFYTAFLVPTLEAARLSALGQSPPAGLDAMTPAWKNDGAAVELPVFYRWRFQTSETGDFETLARRIVAQPLPPTAGERPMSVADPGMGLPRAASSPLAVESALRAADAHSTDWDADEREAWTSALTALVNLPAERLRQPGAPRTLAPPLYGRWYAAKAELDPSAEPPWFQDLNADPRLRVGAALGWQVVQNEQQQLLAGAWAQVDAVREANAQLRHAQLAREAAIRLYERHVLTRSLPSLVVFTQPVHARVRVNVATTTSPTLHAVMAHSPLRVGVLHPAFVRLSRPLGPVGMRQGRALVKAPPTIVNRVNAGQLLVAPPPATPAQLVTSSRAATEIAPPWLTSEVADRVGKIPHPLWTNIEVLHEHVLKAWPKLHPAPPREQLVQLLTGIQEALGAGGSPRDHLERRVALRDGTLTPQQIQAAPPRRGFVAQELSPDGAIRVLPTSTAPEDTRFRTATAALFGDVQAAPAPGDVLRTLDLRTTATALTAAIDPKTTVAASLRRRVGVLPPWDPSDPLEPVMAAPAFPQPMYKPLFDVSPDWILSGLNDLPQDVVSLAHPNERFIESYMLGANDEMGRTLLFNEYPTDQRGSYFRQFWDATGAPAPQPDINAIAAWPKTAALGENATRPGIDGYLVLIVRAELLRRYPNTIVYAVQAQWNADGSRSVPKTGVIELHPEFQGSLGTAARFWGFNLTTTDARGADAPAEGPAGWYFALQEHTSEPRFGLEPPGSVFGGAPDSWQKLAWSDLVTDAAALATLAYVDLGAPLPNVGAIVDPRQARWHIADGARASDLAYATYREPVRILVHASRMIPTDV